MSSNLVWRAEQVELLTCFAARDKEDGQVKRHRAASFPYNELLRPGMGHPSLLAVPLLSSSNAAAMRSLLRE